MTLSKGFSLVELMVVIALSTMVLAFGVPAFSTWKKRVDVEAQTSRLFDNLSHARMQAYAQKQPWALWWGSASPFSSYHVKPDVNGDGTIDGTDTVDPSSGARTVTSTLPVTPPGGVQRVSFDGRGLCNNPMTLRVPNAAGAVHDCVVLSSTRVIKGRWDGSGCVPK